MHPIYFTVTTANHQAVVHYIQIYIVQPARVRIMSPACTASQIFFIGTFVLRVIFWGQQFQAKGQVLWVGRSHLGSLLMNWISSWMQALNDWSWICFHAVLLHKLFHPGFVHLSEVTKWIKHVSPQNGQRPDCQISHSLCWEMKVFCRPTCYRTKSVGTLCGNILLQVLWLPVFPVRGGFWLVRGNHATCKSLAKIASWQLSQKNK